MKFKVILKVMLPGLCGTAPKAEAKRIENGLLSRRLNELTHSGAHETYLRVHTSPGRLNKFQDGCECKQWVCNGFDRPFDQRAGDRCMGGLSGRCDG
ncbi:MAG: hypothetical protein MUE59_02525 [Thiobacillaceae bacterium]|jgi:hypothetical protein|nr:hypothetical protein [Thiobacillaceae bacterium]